MKLVLHPDFNLYEKGGKPFCDSLMVAETFRKEHKHILDSIEGEDTIKNNKRRLVGIVPNLLESAENPADYFIKDKYIDSRNRTQPKYLMSRDGFTLLVMGFTGKEAFKFKLDYINRFNQMEEFINSILTTKMEFPAFTEAVLLAHDEPKHYHFSNEINMIYRIVLGMDAKKFREVNDLEKGVVIKSYLTIEQIKAVEMLQRVDIGLLEIGLDYERRKEVLTNRLLRSRKRIA